MNKSILQSQLWAEVQRADGRKVFSVDDIIIIKHAMPFKKSWLYSPRPVIKDDKHFASLIEHPAPLAKKEQAIFWKVEGVELGIKNKNSNSPACHASRGEADGYFVLRNSCPLQYPETFIIDITQSEEQLQKSMKPKTRYNINLARKKGVLVQWSKNIEDVNIFYDLLVKTAERQKIGIHTYSHYFNILKILGEHNAAALVIAYYNSRPIAANLVTFFDDTATYLHGGTDSRYRAYMAPYLLQWEAIIDAKRRGLRYYDLGGSAVTQGKINKWAGITRFKQGFGGELIQLGGTYDIVFDKKWYFLYKIVRRLTMSLRPSSWSE